MISWDLPLSPFISTSHFPPSGPERSSLKRVLCHSSGKSLWCLTIKLGIEVKLLFYLQPISANLTVSQVSPRSLSFSQNAFLFVPQTRHACFHTTPLCWSSLTELYLLPLLYFSHSTCCCMKFLPVHRLPFSTRTSVLWTAGSLLFMAVTVSDTCRHSELLGINECS